MAPSTQPAKIAQPTAPDPVIAVVEEGSGLESRGWPVTLLRLVAAPDTHPWHHDWRREAMRRSGWKWGAFALVALLGLTTQCGCAAFLLGPAAKVPTAQCEPIHAVPGDVCQTLEATCTFHRLPQGGPLDFPLQLPASAGAVQIQVQAANQQKLPVSLKQQVSVSVPARQNIQKPVTLGEAIKIPASASTSLRLELSAAAAKEWGDLCADQACVAKLEVTASFGMAGALDQMAEAAGDQLKRIDTALSAQSGADLPPGGLDAVLGHLPMVEGRCDASQLIVLGQSLREALAEADGARKQMFGMRPLPFAPGPLYKKFATASAQIDDLGKKTFEDHGWSEGGPSGALWSRYISLVESVNASVAKWNVEPAWYWVRLAISPTASMWRGRVTRAPPIASREDADGRVAFLKALTSDHAGLVPMPGLSCQVNVPDGLRIPPAILNATVEGQPRCYASPVTALPVANALEARTKVAALLELPPVVASALTQAPWHATLAVGSPESVESARTKATPWVALLCADSFHVDVPVAWKDPRGQDLAPLLQLLPLEISVSEALATADDWVARELNPKLRHAADGAVTALLADTADVSSIKEFRDALAVVGAAIDYKTAQTDPAWEEGQPTPPLKGHVDVSIANGIREQFCHRLTSRGLYAEVTIDDFPGRFPADAVDVFDFAPSALACRLESSPLGSDVRGATVTLTAPLIRTWQDAVWARAIGAAGVCPSEVKAKIQRRWFPGDPDKFSEIVSAQSNRLYHVPHFEVPQAHLNTLQGECGAHPCCKDFLALRKQYPDQVTEGTCRDETKPPQILPDDTVPFSAVGRSATRDVACHKETAADILFTLGPQAGRYVNIQSCAEFSAYAHRSKAHRITTHEMRDRCGGEPGYELGIDLSDKASYAKPPHPSVNLWPLMPNKRQRFWMTTTIQNQVH